MSRQRVQWALVEDRQRTIELRNEWTVPDTTKPVTPAWPPSSTPPAFSPPSASPSTPSARTGVRPRSPSPTPIVSSMATSTPASSPRWRTTPPEAPPAPRCRPGRTSLTLELKINFLSARPIRPSGSARPHAARRTNRGGRRVRGLRRVRHRPRADRQAGLDAGSPRRAPLRSLTRRPADASSSQAPSPKPQAPSPKHQVSVQLPA